MKEKIVLFFDTETNGFFGSSVLSFSGMLVRFRLYDDGKLTYKKLEEYDRYYFPIEPYNQGAIEINHLDEETLKEKRKEVTYSENFIHDDYIIEIINKADKYVAHNIKFDRSFLPIQIPEEKQFCTMLENTNIVKSPNKYGKPGYKWPKLIECVNYYGIEVNEEKLHSSLYDVEMLLNVFLKTMESDITLYNKILEFIFS